MPLTHWQALLRNLAEVRDPQAGLHSDDIVSRLLNIRDHSQLLRRALRILGVIGPAIGCLKEFSAGYAEINGPLGVGRVSASACSGGVAIIAPATSRASRGPPAQE